MRATKDSPGWNYGKKTTAKDALEIFKNDNQVRKFMAKYRYQYHVTMLNDLAELVRNAYLEGYNNGLGQHKLASEDSKGQEDTHDA